MVMSLITNLTLEASNCSSCLQDGYHLLLPIIQLAALKVHPLTTDNAGQWSDSVMLLSVYFSLSINSCYMWCSFIHSFIQAISIAPLQVHYYSEALPKQQGYCVRVSRPSATGNCE